MKSFHALMALRRHSVFRGNYPAKFFLYHSRKAIRMGVYYPVAEVTDYVFSMQHHQLTIETYEMAEEFGD